MSCSGMQNVFDTWNKSPFNTPFSFITKLLSVIDIISSIFSHSLKKKRVNSWTRNSHLRILFWLLKRFHAWTAICTYHKKYYTSHFAPYITVLNLNTHKTQNGHTMRQLQDSSSVSLPLQYCTVNAISNLLCECRSVSATGTGNTSTCLNDSKTLQTYSWNKHV